MKNSLVAESAWREKHRMRRGFPEPYCRDCRSAGLDMPLHCPGRMMTYEEQEQVRAGALQFALGKWWKPKE